MLFFDKEDREGSLYVQDPIEGFLKFSSYFKEKKGEQILPKVWFEICTMCIA